MKQLRIAFGLIVMLILSIAVLSFQKPGNLSPTLKFIKENFKYDSGKKTHYVTAAFNDSMDYYSVDGKGFLQVFMGADSTVIKQTFGEPDQNWLYTYRYFMDSCCYHLENMPCSFNCQCLMFRISPEGKCTSVRLGKYFKGQ